jgi:predicted nuclease with RNAse H fold
MRTVGIDLATEAKSTAVAVIDWSPGSAVVRAIEIPAGDDVIRRHAEGAAKVGIDCPLGWPDKFVEFVRNHHEGHPVAASSDDADVWRRSLANRLTDEVVREAFKNDKDKATLVPLSVSTDRIGLTAMRAARLQSGWPVAVDRSGVEGQVVEVYPAAGLLYWGMRYRQYKGSKNLADLDGLVDDLGSKAPWLDLGEFAGECRRSDHAFDAVVAALIARAAALGKTVLPTDDQRDVAAREGWIALPSCRLDELCP